MKKKAIKQTFIIIVIISIIIIISKGLNIINFKDNVLSASNSPITLSEYLRRSVNNQDGVIIFIDNTSPVCAEFPYDLGMKLYVKDHGELIPIKNNSIYPDNGSVSICQGIEYYNDKMWWVVPSEFPKNLNPPYRLLISVEGKIHNEKSSGDEPVQASLEIIWDGKNPQN